ncbi:MAG: tetrahydrofolate dehydrogenase/cyclohydrolase catalytic domain-containing protein, partial [Pseudomonadota bacterium]
MTATLISGKEVAENVRESVAAAVEQLPGQPTLAVVIVGDDAASQVYVRSKVRQTEAVGMRSLHHHLPKDATQFEVENLISDLNADDDVDGILYFNMMHGEHYNTIRTTDRTVSLIIN